MQDANASTLRGSGRGRVAASFLLCALASCGLGDKAALEQRITEAPTRAEEGAVSGTMTVESRLQELPAGGVSGFSALPAAGVGGEGIPDEGIPDEGIPLSTRTVAFTMELGGQRAALRWPDAETAHVVIDDLVYFGRRAGVPDDDARPWVRMALDDLAEGTGSLDPIDQSRAAADAVSAVHPAVITDLVAGSLTGSIESAGADTVAGVPVTRYEVNVALDKAFEDTRRKRYPEDRLEAVELLIEALGVDGNVHPATVWLDEDDRLRRFTVRLTQRPMTKVEFALVVTIEIDSYDAVHRADTPTPREVLTVDSVLRFVATVAEDEPEDVVPPGLGDALEGAVAEDDPVVSTTVAAVGG